MWRYRPLKISVKDIRRAHKELEAYDSHWDEQMFGAENSAPGVQATITGWDGEAVPYVDRTMVVHYEAGNPFILLQTCLLEEHDRFDGLFSREVKDGEFGFHKAYEPNSGIYVVPVEACGAAEPVPAIAALCLGSEALNIDDRPNQAQKDALFTAAKITLSET